MDKNKKKVSAKPMADGAETISGGSGDGLRRRRRLSPPGQQSHLAQVQTARRRKGKPLRRSR